MKEETKKAILELQTLYPEKRSALIPALHLAQKDLGYLPLEVQQEVADLFGIELNEVHGVVTFYDMFFEEPKGKHIIHVCKNVSCMLRGGDQVLEGFCQRLQISPGGTSADGKYTVIPSECLAACDKAPMIILDEEVMGPIQEHDIDAILRRSS